MLDFIVNFFQMTLLHIIYVHNKTKNSIQSLIEIYGAIWENSEYGEYINKPTYLAVLETSIIHGASSVNPINIKRQRKHQKAINGNAFGLA